MIYFQVAALLLIISLMIGVSRLVIETIEKHRRYRERLPQGYICGRSDGCMIDETYYICESLRDGIILKKVSGKHVCMIDEDDADMISQDVAAN